MDLLEFTNVIDTIKSLQPDEVYNPAAQSFVKAFFEQPFVTANVDALGVLSVLDAIKHFSPVSKFAGRAVEPKKGIADTKERQAKQG